MGSQVRRFPPLLGAPLMGNWSLEKFLFKLIASHLDEFKANELKVRRVKRWSTGMVVSFILSVVCLGASMLSYAPDVQHPDDVDGTAASSELFDYDAEPFEPTLVEKGDNPYYDQRTD